MRFATVGTNFITDRMLAAGSLCNEFELAAVYSRDPGRAREYASAHGAALWFCSHDELAACGEIDAVYIASPNCCHAAQAIDLLRSGKHVLCEKPIATNARELENMQQAARQNGRLLLEAMRPAFGPQLGAVKAALQRIGRVRRAALDFCQYSSRYDRYKAGERPNAFDPGLSNAAVMDLGVYCVHVLLLLFGRPQKIAASCTRLENGFEAGGTIMCDYDGMQAVLTYSKITDSLRPGEIQGEDGVLTIGTPYLLHDVTLTDRKTKRAELVFGADEHDMRHEIIEFIRLANSGGQAEEHTARSLAAMRILDEARRQCGVVFPADALSPS